ncbi:DNA-binding response OmpR family regulator [Alkalibacillus filiformis]|uniref:DNA-binding response OmpR family regulator n=1 Tax=Alkalibacillus filiformis TaxID=200990 RepID=A0ABU0DSR5_9BACI|nr:response regulator transcription factor [Alkalibacillus filiformis]MDQ0351481.1 DNA-binding response OmpR family regulator [Alkalibacillus filiformis]
MYKVMIIDDETRMLDLIEIYLQPYSFKCFKCVDGEKALERLNQEDMDLVILDIMLPEMDGFELCKEIRTFSNVPIIMLTAREGQEDIIKGLKLGADDYITKPFDENELVARMEALLRRIQSENIIEINGLIWNKDRFELSFNNESISLTPIEFELIGYLIKHPNKVYERELLIDLVWGFAAIVEGRTVDSHIRNIREKLRVLCFPIDNHLKTVWGIGYKWVD